MKKSIVLECAQCGKPFDKVKSEYARQIRCGRTHNSFFCSRSCTGKAVVNNLGDAVGDIKHLLQGYDQSDELSAFKVHLRRAKARSKDSLHKPIHINAQYLKDLWEAQQGKCALSNVPLVLERKTSNPIYSASLDRINSNQGYIKGNVQFVSVIINRAKNNSPDSLILEFLEIIRKTQTREKP